jgi:protocatechuate 3,4-dioxygenase beta subunit
MRMGAPQWQRIGQYRADRLPRPTLNFVHGGMRVDKRPIISMEKEEDTMPVDFAFDQRGLSRRVLMATTSMALVGIAFPHLAIAALTPTPRQTAGPFYPKSLPLHSDNDLVRIAGHEKQAEGIVTHISGRVLNGDGRPVPRARIEIWQCDSHGRYHNVDDRSSRLLDPNFQGYGTTSSSDDGGYRFRTIKPVAYPGRTPHIHFAIAPPGGGRLVTQMYVAGESANERDPVLNAIRDQAARARVVVPLEPASQIEAGALSGTFEIVLSA